MKKVRGVCVTDCKVIPGEACLTQHRLVCAAFQFLESKKKKLKEMRKIKIWKLKDRETRDVFQERLKEKIASSGDGEGKTLKKTFLSAGGEICGITSGNRGRQRETWWWNDVVQQRLKEKNVAYKRWQLRGTEVDRETYKDRKQVARREIAIAERGAWEKRSKILNTAERRGKMFRVAKQ